MANQRWSSLNIEILGAYSILEPPPLYPWNHLQNINHYFLMIHDGFQSPFRSPPPHRAMCIHVIDHLKSMASLGAVCSYGPVAHLQFWGELEAINSDPRYPNRFGKNLTPSLWHHRGWTWWRGWRWRSTCNNGVSLKIKGPLKYCGAIRL